MIHFDAEFENHENALMQLNIVRANRADGNVIVEDVIEE